MKIAFFETNPIEESFIKEKLKGNEVVFIKDKLSVDNIELIKDFDIISVFIYSKLNKDILSRLKNLKAICTRSTGFEHIDLDYCNKKKIKVFNVPLYGENTVAEHTFALILSLTRKIHKSYERTVRGDFSLDGLTGVDLKGKTIGVIGSGKIGANVIRIAKGFMMDVIVYDIFKNEKLSKELGFSYVELEYLLKNSDIITLHCPLTQKTRYIINEKNINNIKKGAIIINTARGGLLDTKAVVGALVKDDLSGVAVDVLEDEFLVKEEVQLLSNDFPKENIHNMLINHVLLTFDNVIVTPHNAFNSKEALQRIIEVTIDNINEFILKKEYKNIVN